MTRAAHDAPGTARSRRIAAGWASSAASATETSSARGTAAGSEGSAVSPSSFRHLATPRTAESTADASGARGEAASSPCTYDERSLDAADPSLPRMSSRVAAATCGETSRSDESWSSSAAGASRRFERQEASSARARATSTWEISERRKSESSRGGHQDMSASATRTPPSTGVGAGQEAASSERRATERASSR